MPKKVESFPFLCPLLFFPDSPSHSPTQLPFPRCLANTLPSLSTAVCRFFCRQCIRRWAARCSDLRRTNGVPAAHRRAGVSAPRPRDDRHAAHRRHQRPSSGPRGLQAPALFAPWGFAAGCKAPWRLAADGEGEDRRSVPHASGFISLSPPVPLSLSPSLPLSLSSSLPFSLSPTLPLSLSPSLSLPLSLPRSLAPSLPRSSLPPSLPPSWRAGATHPGRRHREPAPARERATACARSNPLSRPGLRRRARQQYSGTLPSRTSRLWARGSRCPRSRSESQS